MPDEVCFPFDDSGVCACGHLATAYMMVPAEDGGLSNDGEWVCDRCLNAEEIPKP